jgi:site-specific recombinase XerD
MYVCWSAVYDFSSLNTEPTMNITTDPVKGEDIAKVRDVVQASPRDLALFVISTNTAFRASDILSLNCGDVRNLKAGGCLKLKEQKTGNNRIVTINQLVIDALAALLAAREPVDDDEPLFVGAKRGTRLTVSGYGRMVKHWCELAGLEGEYSSHSLRKSFGYTLRTQHKVDLAIIQEMYGHSSGRVTLKYVGIQAEELAAVYMLGVQ